MIHLILAIVSSASVSVVMRLSEERVRNNVSMLALNYLMCALMAGTYAGPANLLAGGDGSGFCTACFDGLYPTEEPTLSKKSRFERWERPISENPKFQNKV